MQNSLPELHRVAERRFTWAPWAVVAFAALLPTVGYAEAVLVFTAVSTVVILGLQRFRHGTSLLSREAWALSTALFFCYWLPEFFSAFDALNEARAWREALVDLRYLPFLWLVAIAASTLRGRAVVWLGLGLLALLWTIDGSVQIVSGHSLGGDNSSDRLSGIFGPDNLKLGLVLAALSPFALELAVRHFGAAGWALAALAIGTVVLLAGTRAAWLMLAIVLVLHGWRCFGRRRVLVLVLVGFALVSVLAVGFSTQFQGRIERSAAVLSGDRAGVNEALSYRLNIWRAAVRMSLDHPVNGVGVRGFRDAYPQYAQADDPWLSKGQPGALYAYQMVLEVLSETGAIGLLLWLMGAALALRGWRWASAAARERAAVPGLALLAMVFPLNTHLAFYSTFWGGMFLLVMALFAGALFGHDPDDASVA